MSRFLEAAKKMPLLAHYRSRQFDILESDVARWLADTAEGRQLLFNFCKSAGVIQYVDGKWVGAEAYARLKR